MKKKLLFAALFAASLAMFAAQTMQAFGIVSFHVDFFAKKGVIVLDPGHGGEDGGASSGSGALEKDINLAIALELKKDLERNFFEVILTRDGDYAIGDLSLSTVSQRKRSDILARVQMVEESGDCILISIHQNHFTEAQYSGAQMFYSPNHPDSKALAEAIRQSVAGSLQPENHRETKEAESSIFLLSNVHVPSVLVECGFLSNPQEAAKLCDEAYQKDMAAAIYNGLIDYLQAKARTAP